MFKVYKNIAITIQKNRKTRNGFEPLLEWFAIIYITIYVI